MMGRNNLDNDGFEDDFRRCQEASAEAIQMAIGALEPLLVAATRFPYHDGSHLERLANGKKAVEALLALKVQKILKGTT